MSLSLLFQLLIQPLVFLSSSYNVPLSFILALSHVVTHFSSFRGGKKNSWDVQNGLFIYLTFDTLSLGSFLPEKFIYFLGVQCK
jgi:hypothetical protein